MGKTALALMSHKEIAAVNREDAVLILPVGCVEQHGPAGYVGADTMVAESVALRAAQSLHNVYVAPPLWYGHTTYTAFAGTVSLRLETLRALLEDVVGGYVQHGFRHIMVFNNHGPNEAAIEPVATLMNQRHGIVMGNFYPWRLAEQIVRRMDPEHAASVGHGGSPTISVMMALAPGAVDLDHTDRRGYVDVGHGFRLVSNRSAEFDGFNVGLYTEAAEVFPSGARGDWQRSTEEEGRAILDEVVQYATRLIPAFLSLSKARKWPVAEAASANAI